VGVDILGDCIEQLKTEFGCSDMYAGDILRDELPFMNGTIWDAIFLPEVLEHIDDPVSFLTELRQRFAGQVKELIVSVPNALSCVYPPFVRRGQELVNTDHRYIFTPYTLAKVAVMSGYQVGDIVMCEYGRGSRRRVFRNWYLKKYPLARADIVMRLTPSSS
jgi:SAM-dependent methyltransferase